MSLSRRSIRESAFLIIYEKSFGNYELDELFDIAKESENIPINSEVEKIVNGVFEHLDELDNIISQFSQKRSIERIPKINLSLLRLAIYEAKYSENVPTNVAISEAVAIAEKYAFDSDAKFINGALGAYSRSEGASLNA